MQTLSYGYKNPENGDRGSVWFPALNANITQLNDHTHNGVNSAKLSPTGITALVQTIASAASGGWAAVSGKDGLYSKTVTLPVAITGLAAANTIDDYQLMIKNDTSGDLLYLTINKASASTFNVFSNDNSLNLRVYYLT